MTIKNETKIQSGVGMSFPFLNRTFIADSKLLDATVVVIDKGASSRHLVSDKAKQKSN